MSVVLHEKSPNLVCQQRAVQNTSLSLPNPRKSVIENTCAYVDDVELEELGEEDVETHCTPQTALVSGTPIFPLGCTRNH